ncbi:secreted protein [Neisseria meningitidis]|nr:YdgA family protein [Neisseria meningitidis]AOT30345.1 hypothetical protein AN159_03990 [Neisseria meningitidis]ELK66898.1 hypothetical protein NM88050_0608 [Neisseria meningitidis 88050]ELL08139.1 hypothetical protein NM2004090_1408 [Neisseria meningitidis 2004090]ELL08816.1 hypothetical protein NM96023_1116 [Neisseria meningitidis 96023]ELL14839.1 hypothetical protein NM97020_1336 [Neisseria meningitidis 97020]
MKKPLISVAAALLGVALGTPYYLGVKAEESLTQQQKILQEAGFLTVESHQYERGWFTSTETTVIRLKPELLHNAQKYLPDNLKTVLEQPVTLVNHITHGPFAGGFGTQAYIETEFKYAPETEKVLERFFGKQVPVSLANTVYFNGSGKMEVSVPAFDYEELSGIRLHWEGLTGETVYQKGFKSYRNGYDAPLFKIKLADKGDAAFEKVHFDSETSDGINPLALGSSNLTLEKFSLEWKEGVDYNVKLNELVNLVTDLQIGAFINPNGSIAPSKIEVGKLAFSAKTGESGAFIDSEGQFRFGTLVYGDEKYGPLDIHIAAEHLDASALTVLKRKFARISAKKMTEEQIRNDLIAAVKGEASGLFTHNPVLDIKTFRFTLPSGKIDVGGKIMFKDMKKEDLNQLGLMLKKTEADIRMSIPQKMLEDLAVSQAGNIFSVNAEDEAEGRASLDDINETLRLMVDSTVQSMAREKYLTLNGDQIDTAISLKNNQLKLNGKTLQNEPEPDFDEGGMVSEPQQ